MQLKQDFIRHATSHIVSENYLQHSYNFFPGTQVVPVINNPPAMHTHTHKNEAWVLALGPEEPLVESIPPTQVFLPGESHG